MTLLGWLSIVFVCVLGAMSPGPSLAVVIRRAVSGGSAQGLATAWAHAMGIGIYALITTFGLAAIIARSAPVSLAISIVGATYLAWLGVQALRHAAHAEIPEAASASGGTIRAAREGFLVAMLNPKVAVFFLAIFSQFLTAGMHATEHATLSATAMCVDGLWYTTVVLLLTRAKWMQLFRQRVAWVERATGIVLLALAFAGALRLVLQ